jgi:methyl halide transferase
MYMTLSAEYWEDRYQRHNEPWDIGEPAPPLVSFFESDAAPQSGIMAVPGCGKGHEALYCAQKGFTVYGFDFAPSAITNATGRVLTEGVNATFLERDVFTLPEEFPGHFDYVLEHTCFCAIDPEQRAEYVQVIHQILKPKGALIALFFTHSRPGGPPFGTNLEELERLFDPYFTVQSLEKPSNSTEGRENDELLAHLIKI